MGDKFIALAILLPLGLKARSDSLNQLWLKDAVKRCQCRWWPGWRPVVFARGDGDGDGVKMNVKVLRPSFFLAAPWMEVKMNVKSLDLLFFLAAFWMEVTMNVKSLDLLFFLAAFWMEVTMNVKSLDFLFFQLHFLGPLCSPSFGSLEDRLKASNTKRFKRTLIYFDTDT